MTLPHARPSAKMQSRGAIACFVVVSTLACAVPASAKSLKDTLKQHVREGIERSNEKAKEKSKKNKSQAKPKPKPKAKPEAHEDRPAEPAKQQPPQDAA